MNLNPLKFFQKNTANKIKNHIENNNLGEASSLLAKKFTAIKTCQKKLRVKLSQNNKEKDEQKLKAALKTQKERYARYLNLHKSYSKAYTAKIREDLYKRLQTSSTSV
ncbi:hypothetical protein [Candidatus Williamhamiltonella defendens]|uniref:hypothetical protein n=1 Tax=Candidatus Williamhamiltonella defendens TaxID=138072 RepID=UPI0002E6E2E6|nr:hypothetical protein [Candidatus Hamiltonella defensa]